MWRRKNSRVLSIIASFNNRVPLACPVNLNSGHCFLVQGSCIACEATLYGNPFQEIQTRAQINDVHPFAE